MSTMIRKATVSDLDAVTAIYNNTHSAEEAGLTTVGWVRGVYPTRATAENALARNDLFVAENEGHIVATAIFNHEQDDCYATAPWRADLPAEQIMVMHTLAVEPSARAHGIGRSMVAFYENYARSNGCHALRIDTNITNTVARNLYAKLDYTEIAVRRRLFNNVPNVQLVLLEKILDEQQ